MVPFKTVDRELKHQICPVVVQYLPNKVLVDAFHAVMYFPKADNQECDVQHGAKRPVKSLEQAVAWLESRKEDVLLLGTCEEKTEAVAEGIDQVIYVHSFVARVERVAQDQEQV